MLKTWRQATPRERTEAITGALVLGALIAFAIVAFVGASTTYQYGRECAEHAEGQFPALRVTDVTWGRYFEGGERAAAVLMESEHIGNDYKATVVCYFSVGLVVSSTDYFDGDRMEKFRDLSHWLDPTASYYP